MNEQDRPTADMFEPLLNSEFTVHLDDQNSIKVKLTEVTRLPPSTEREDLPIRKDPFSLIFKVVDQVDLPQRMYSLEHETIGTRDFFLVPVGFGEYQSIFN